MSSIVIKNLQVSYPLAKNGVERAIKGLSASFPSSSFCLVSGPSGCGKSTLLKTLAGLIPYDGTIAWGDRDFAELDYKELQASYLSQDLILYPHKDVFYNIAFPLLSLRIKKEDIRLAVYRYAKEVGLSYLLARNIEELSFGQQELVALGKSLMKNPSTLLLDEPFAGLDAPRRAKIGDYLKKWGQEHQATIIYVGHSVNEGVHLADRFYLMEEGTLAFEGGQKELKSSSNRAAMEFLRLGEISL